MKIRPLVAGDWRAVAEIYRQGIESGHATFETEVPTWEAWDRGRHAECRLVAELDGRVVGFAAVTPVSRRRVYAGVGEVMVYVAEDARSRGVGGRLMHDLVACSEAVGLWTLQASIFPENVASIRVHAQVGFRELGTRERIGRFHDGRWRDTVIMERRSEVVGTD